MSVRKIIDYDVPVVSPAETGDNVLRIMEDNSLEQIAVTGDDQYLALLKLDELQEWESPEGTIGESDLLRYSPAVHVDSHAFDVLKLAYNQKLAIVPVVDSDNKYQGAVTRESLLNYLAEAGGLDAPGGVIVLEINPTDYSLYQVARIAESEDVALIATQLYTNRVTNKLELTIKTNRNNLEALAATYERFGFTVMELYGERSNRDDMMDRYNLLMAWLNM